jgi:sigma-B regulation protein RsbU (phosphoserine phosphatase)
VVTAGHPPLLHLGVDGRIQRLGAAAPPLGTRLPQTYREASAPLAAGDVVLFYTDGASELADLRCEQFGDERLAAALERAHRQAGGPAAATASAVRESILASLSGHKSDGPQLDDITLVVARVGELPA